MIPEKEYCLVLTNTGVDSAMLNRLILWHNPPSVLRTDTVPTKTRLECNKFASDLDIQLSSFFYTEQQKIKPSRRCDTD